MNDRESQHTSKEERRLYVCRSTTCVDNQTNTAAISQSLMQTDHVEAPDADAPSHAELPTHLQDTDGSDIQNIVFAAKVGL